MRHRPPVTKMGAGHNGSAGSLIANALRLAFPDGCFCILSNSSPFRWRYYRYVRRCWRHEVPALFRLHTCAMIFAAACQSYAMHYKLVQISSCRRTLLRWFTTSFLYLFLLFFGHGYFRSAYFCVAWQDSRFGEDLTQTLVPKGKIWTQRSELGFRVCTGTKVWCETRFWHVAERK
jgi:hypothetical protein